MTAEHKQRVHKASQSLQKQLGPEYELRAKKDHPDSVFAIAIRVLGWILSWLTFRDDVETYWYVFVGSTMEHRRGQAIDVALYYQDKPLYILPWYNVYMSKEQALHLWDQHGAVFKAAKVALAQNDVTMSEDLRERLQIHCIIREKV